MSYNGNYTPLVSVRHQFNSGLWLKCPCGGIGRHTGLRNQRHRKVAESSSLSEGTNAEMAELVDAPASKAGVLKGRVGSSPTFGTNGDMV